MSWAITGHSRLSKAATWCAAASFRPAVQVEREQAGELERSGQVQSSLAEAHSRLKAFRASLKGLEGRTTAAASKLQQGDQSCLLGALAAVAVFRS